MIALFAVKPPPALLGGLRRGFGAVPLLVKIIGVIGAIKLQHQIAIDRRRIAGQVVGANAGWEAFDDGVGIGL